jgi:exopolysaccharide production protein ExoZ
MLRTIQAARGVAALSVAAYHLSLGFGDPRYLGHTVLMSLTWRFNLGVDFFFVLSGFIITFAHEDDIGRPDRWLIYIARRFTRVYPIYWVYTAGLCALVLILPSTIVLPTDSISWVSIATLIRGNDVVPPLPPAWSLFHEVVFYCIFSFLIINRTIGTAALAAWLAIIFALFSPGVGTPLLVWTSAYNLNFFVGIGAFLLWKRGGARLCRSALIVGVALILASFLAELNGYSLTVFQLLYALGFGGIITGLASIETNASKINIPVLGLLGDASYSIYLLHMPFQGFFMKIFINRLDGYLTGPYSLYLAVLACALAAAIAAHLMIEAPLMRYFRSRPRREAFRVPV